MEAGIRRPEDFRFKDFVDDAVALVDICAAAENSQNVILVGHSEGGLVAILTARRVPIDRLVLLVTAARRQGDLVKAQLEKDRSAGHLAPIAKAIDAIMAGQIVDPPPPGCRSRRRCSPASPRHSPKIRSIP